LASQHGLGQLGFDKSAAAFETWSHARQQIAADIVASSEPAAASRHREANANLRRAFIALKW
jgi:hypothetical protein